MNLTDKEALFQLEELEKHPGYKYLMEVVNNETVTAALKMGDERPMAPEEYHFLRGMICSGRRFADVTSKLKRQLNSRLAKEAAMELLKSASADANSTAPRPSDDERKDQ